MLSSLFPEGALVEVMAWKLEITDLEQESLCRLLFQNNLLHAEH
jgi:hypothetical protein